MQLKDKEGWEKAVQNNQDPYGKAVIDYCEKWATLMEAKLAEGKTIPEIAKDTSHEADTDGITGFMYGCAVNILSHAWVNGEELRKWHNIDTQIDKEGERANETGRVLNPALLVIGGNKK